MAQRDSGKKKGRHMTEHLRYCSEKEWTWEQAAVEDINFKGTNAVSPLARWFAMRDLDLLQQIICEEKSSRAVLLAIRECAEHRLAMPDWLAHEFINQVHRVTSGQVASWDEVFGRPLPKGRHLETRRSAYLNQFSVLKKVTELRASGLPVGKGLFEMAAEQLNKEFCAANALPYKLTETPTEKLYRQALMFVPNNKKLALRLFGKIFKSEQLAKNLYDQIYGSIPRQQRKRKRQ